MPIRIAASPREITGVLWFARADRTFEDDEVALIAELIGKVELSAAEIIAHHTIREQALTDPLTGLGNRRKLGAELERRIRRRQPVPAPAVRPRRLQGLQRHVRPPRGRSASLTPGGKAAARGRRSRSGISPRRRRVLRAPGSGRQRRGRDDPRDRRRVDRNRHRLHDRRVGRRGRAAARSRQPRARAPARGRAHVRQQATPLDRRPRAGGRGPAARDACQAARARRALEQGRRPRHEGGMPARRRRRDPGGDIEGRSATRHRQGRAFPTRS